MNFLGVTYDNVKNHKKAGSCTFFRRYIFQKITWGDIILIIPSCFRAKRVTLK